MGKAVHVPGLKKALKTAWTRIGQCQPCLKEQRGANAKKGASSSSCPPPAPGRPRDPSKQVEVWMCLRCGLQLCDSNSTSDHFHKHHEVPRSDLHCVGLNVCTWKLWWVE